MKFLSRDKVHIRPARLEDSQILSRLQKDHFERLNILDIPRSPEKIRLSIGSGLLNQNNFFVVEEEDEVVGFIEHKKTNESHVMIGYPYVSLSHPDREKVQKDMLKETMEKLAAYGYQYVSTQVSNNMHEGLKLYDEMGFGSPKPVFQSYEGYISPDPEIDADPYEIKRVTIDHIDLMYSWIKRQLNPFSPIYITKRNFARLLHAPKEVREGWAMLYKDGDPVAFISSMIDAQTGRIVVFGPFNDPEHIDVRVPLFNELMLYHKLNGRDYLRLMRIRRFDNDEQLIADFGLEQSEEITILSRKL
jgi:hypothetical protein